MELMENIENKIKSIVNPIFGQIEVRINEAAVKLEEKIKIRKREELKKKREVYEK